MCQPVVVNALAAGIFQFLYLLSLSVEAPTGSKETHSKVTSACGSGTEETMHRRGLAKQA